ncbi:MAG: acyl-CoA dehydrogenase family protein [Solirubrobacteraceae bacterium]|nr:acyl-CoA dehydrogenase family protein [Solirubrobacteraceae bacterium]
MRRTIFEDEHEAFRETARGFLEREAVPRGDAWEADGVIDRPFWRASAELGLVGFAADEEHGGAGLRDFRFNAVLDEEVVATGARTDAFSLTNDIVVPYFTDLASEEQQARWLPSVTTGDAVIAIAMSEPGTGSDLRAIASTATWRGDHYELSGSKTFITSGIQADLVVVAAKTVREGVDGIGLFVVPATADGFTRGRKLEKIGRKAQDTAELFFDGVRVPEADVIGDPGKGLRYMMRNLPQERLSMAVTAVAHAEKALAITLDYVKERNAFGRPIGTFQANRHALAELSTEVAIARSHVDRCIDAQVVGELTPVEAAGAKFWTTELEFRVMDRCLQLHGGYGYMEEYEIARMWRDSRVQRIYGGTNEIMREIVGRDLGL